MGNKEAQMCEVCKEREVHSVCASSLGPVSFGYCKECLAAGREPYWFIISSLVLSGIQKYETISEHHWIKPTIQNTLLLENKTIEEFNMDLKNEADNQEKLSYNEMNFEEPAIEEPVSLELPIEEPGVAVPLPFSEQEDEREIPFEYCEVIKGKPTTKKFSLSKGELKLIVDSLEDFVFSMEKLLEDENLPSYNRALYGVKIRQTKKVSEKIKEEIHYCEKCNKKEREETGLSGLEAAINGVR